MFITLSRLIALLSIGLLVGCGSGGSESPSVTKSVYLSSTTQMGMTYVAPQTGWYWNPAEAGRGFAIERQGNQLFLAAFLYEANGPATWYVSTLTAQAQGQYVGELTRYSGGQSLSGTFKAAGGSKMGYATLSFLTATAGNLSITPASGGTPVSISVQRFPISTPTAFAPSSGTFDNGWWWSDAEPGRGYFIEVQGSQAFIGSFMYDGAGEPTWYVSSATVQGGQSVSAALTQYSNGQSLLGNFKAAAAASGSPGTMQFNFTGANTANIALPGGRNVAVTRFSFNPPTPNPAPAPTCVSPQVLLNGACTTPTAYAPIAPSLWFEVAPSPAGTTYTAELCYGGAQCTSLGAPVFVSAADLLDPAIPAAILYATQVANEFNNMITRMWQARTYPTLDMMVKVFSGAIAADLANDTRDAVVNAGAGFASLGFPAAQGTGTPAPLACTASQVLKNGVCVASTVSCTAPQVLQNGACVAPAVTCTAPQVLQNGECVTVVSIIPQPYGYLQINTPANHSTSDICTSWQVIGAPVKLSTCAYKSGGSGFAVIENDGVPADLCWTITYNNGASPNKGCYLGMPSGEIDKLSCYSCGLQSGGVRMIELTTFRPK